MEYQENVRDLELYMNIASVVKATSAIRQTNGSQEQERLILRCSEANVSTGVQNLLKRYVEYQELGYKRKDPDESCHLLRARLSWNMVIA